MNSDKLKIIINIKKFIIDLDDILVRFPNREKILKDKIKSISYDILELVYRANYLEVEVYNKERIEIQSNILAKISFLDFLFEESYHKGYITESIFHKKIEESQETPTETTFVVFWLCSRHQRTKNAHGA